MSERSQFPAGGWQYFEPATGWFAPTPLSSTFNQTVEQIRKMRQANAALRLPTDFEAVARDLENFTRRREHSPVQFGNGDNTLTHGRRMVFGHWPGIRRAMAEAAAVKNDLPPTVVFVHVLNSPEFLGWTQQFLALYQKNPPGMEHRTIVVFNNGRPTEDDIDRFDCLPNCRFLTHDNSGQDIGGFIAASREIDSPWAVYFGTTSYVQRAGWLVRMKEAWEKHGFGFYGSVATYEVSPHLNTTGFWCSPKLLLEYPHRVVSKQERYSFEHGPAAMWKIAESCGLPVFLVTWDGEYSWQDWRAPDNIYRRGDQSNCVTYFRHTTNYANADSSGKRFLESLANRISDPAFY